MTQRIVVCGDVYDAAWLAGTDAGQAVLCTCHEDGVRPLRFDCAKGFPLADFAVLADGGSEIEPVFVLSPTSNDVLDRAKHALVSLMEKQRARVHIFR